MINLRNSSLRVRDIRKLIGSKYPLIKWDLGIQEKGEWVFASLESEENKEKLLLLLESKNVMPSCEPLFVEPGWAKIQRITWGDVLSSPEEYFGESDSQLYHIDLSWVLEYKSLQIFGSVELLKIKLRS